MTTGTIHTHGKEWKQVRVVGDKKDTVFIDGKRVLLARHSKLPGTIQFWYEPRDGKHYSVENDAFWLTIDEEEKG